MKIQMTSSRRIGITAALAAFAPENFAAAKPIRIHFGSCSENVDKSQPMWKVVHDRVPNAFIWAGDIVYGDHVNGQWTGAADAIHLGEL